MIIFLIALEAEQKSQHGQLRVHQKLDQIKDPNIKTN